MADVDDRLAESVRELEAQRANVLESNKLKNDLIAVLAHDIKGPLTSIIGFAELLEEGYLEGDAAADAAKTIRTNAQRLATLANDVLSLSRVEPGELEIADQRVDLIDVLNLAIEPLKDEREIRFEPSLAQACVRGDAERLRQVFEGIVRNAIRYSPDGEPVEVTIVAHGDEYAIAVADRGIGIPPDEVSKLFARFGRASNAKRAKISGTGIGLFVARAVVERHGGSVEVATTLGEGSTFTVTLPSVDAPRSQRPMRVTMVCGDDRLRGFVTYELRSRGYRVQEFSSVEDLAAARELRDGDVVLADDRVANPRAIRELLPSSGTIRAVGVVESGADGWDQSLRRPFLVTELLAVLGAPGAK